MPKSQAYFAFFSRFFRRLPFSRPSRWRWLAVPVWFLLLSACALPPSCNAPDEKERHTTNCPVCPTCPAVPETPAALLCPAPAEPASTEQAVRLEVGDWADLPGWREDN
ncbi:MAG: hypothetical protein LBS89_04135, partial [Zoogloeaceae bacterium]|nr:hypothetical protein [Zoogloeaceae bacterium]